MWRFVAPLFSVHFLRQLSSFGDGHCGSLRGFELGKVGRETNLVLLTCSDKMVQYRVRSSPAPGAPMVARFGFGFARNPHTRFMPQ